MASHGVIRQTIQHDSQLPDAVFFPIAFGLIYLLAWVMLQHVMFSWDVSWLEEASRRLLAGGTYRHDFFENNPPLILYVYAPAAFFSAYLQCSAILSMQVYILLLIGLSLLASTLLSKPVFADDVDTRRLFMVTLAVLLLLFPSYEFGQRDHLFAIFTMPYLLLLCCRLQGVVVNKAFAFVVGLFAAIAFCLKPYFLVTWLLLEGYGIVSKKSMAFALRPESVTVALAPFAYLLLIYFVHYDYLSDVLPMAARWCYGGDWMPWVLLLKDRLFDYSALIFLMWFSQRRYYPHQKLMNLLVVATVGFAFSWLIQRTNWYYHILPVFSGSMLIATLLYSHYVASARVGLYQTASLTLVAAVILYFDLCARFNLIGLALIEPVSVFVFYSILFAGGLILLHRNSQLTAWGWLRLAISAALALATSGLFYKLLIATDWYAYRFILASSMAAILFGVLAPARLAWGRRLFIFVFGVILFSYPYCQMVSLYNKYSEMKLSLQKIESFLQVNATNKSVYFISTDLGFTFPTVAYSASNTTYASRFSLLWMIPDIYAPSDGDLRRDRDNKQAADVVIKMVADDIDKNHPDFILVDTKKMKNKFSFYSKTHGEYHRLYRDFDYIKTFSQNGSFASAFKSYHYFTTIDQTFGLIPQPLYRFDVYQRD